MSLSKITPCLWFDKCAEEAAKHYTSIFKNSKILKTSRYSDDGQDLHGQPAGRVLTAEFELDGHRFTGLNGGSQFQFGPAISFQVDCADQDEVDYFWEKLGEGGDEKHRQCGWLTDRFGVSWQIIPRVLPQLMSDPDVEKVKRVTAAMLKMKKLDVAGLQKACGE